MLRTIRLSLAEIDPSAVSRPADLRALRAVPQAPIELFRGAIGLAAREVAAAHAALLRPFAERVIEALAPHVEQLGHEARGVADLDARLSATLGPHGRLFDDVVMVGTRSLPGEQGPLDVEMPLALIAHEAAVRAASAALARHGLAASWPLLERVALDSGALAYRGTRAEAAHAVWAAALSLSGLAPRDPVTVELAQEAAAALRG